MTVPQRPAVLAVDPDPVSRAALAAALSDTFTVLEAADADTALRLMEENWIKVVLSDRQLGPRCGLAFLDAIRDRWPETLRIALAGADAGADLAEAAQDRGLYQVVTRPWHPDQLATVVRNATRLFDLSRDRDRMRLEMRVMGDASGRLQDRRRLLQSGMGFDRILRGPASPLDATVRTARNFAGFDVPVLISGEAGTGKADLAHAIHHASLRADRAFVAFDCAGLSDRMIEAELFGVRRSPQPGAPLPRTGLLQKADRGTIYLAGVETLSPPMQVALLRVMTCGAFEQVGGTEPQATGARVLAGSQADLRAAVASGSVRADLYYALAVTELALPPLRARRCDIPLLAETHLFEAAIEHGKPVSGFSAEALTFLEAYDWPGNLPELRNEVTRMLIAAQDSRLGPELISRHILQAAPDRSACRGGPAIDPALLEGSLRERVERMEQRILGETLTRLKWNKSRAAEELGLSRAGLRAKLDRYGISPRAVMAEEG